jgi:hypothetical protein
MATSKQRSTAIKHKKVGAKKTSVAAALKPIRKTRSSTRIESNNTQTTPSKSSNVLQQLIEKHQCIAFIGITHDNLRQAFRNVLADRPEHTWEKILIFFPSDGCLKTLTRNYAKSKENMIVEKKTCKHSLCGILSPVVKVIRFLEYDQLFHCGSYWDWNAQGGLIHISPLTWGANPKICPAMNYCWKEKEPGSEYQVYRDGLEYLLNIATSFE